MASAAFCALLIAHISETDGTPASATRNNAEVAFADADYQGSCAGGCQYEYLQCNTHWIGSGLCSVLPETQMTGSTGFESFESANATRAVLGRFYADPRCDTSTCPLTGESASEHASDLGVPRRTCVLAAGGDGVEHLILRLHLYAACGKRQGGARRSMSHRS